MSAMTTVIETNGDVVAKVNAASAASGPFLLQLAANTTRLSLATTAGPAGETTEPVTPFIICVQQSARGPFTLGLTTADTDFGNFTIHWVGGTAPTISTGSGLFDILSFDIHNLPDIGNDFLIGRVIVQGVTLP